MVKLLRDRGREQEANEAHVKLREVCKFQSSPLIIVTSTCVAEGDSGATKAFYASCYSLDQLAIEVESSDMAC